MRRFLCILSAVFALVANPAFAEDPGFEIVRPRAIEVLRSEMRDSDRWIKVHAAEALLQMGYPEGVEAEFQRELARHGDQPEYRIGIRRVLARATADPRRYAELTGQIKAVFLNPDAPDRVHAIETLGKLEVGLSDEERASVAQYAQETRNPFAYWVLAQHGREEAVAELERLEGSDDSTTALRAAFCLRQLRPLSKKAWLEKGGRTQVISGLESDNVGDRMEACQLLGDFGTPDDKGLLLPLLADPDPDVRIRAAKGLLLLERQGTNAMSIVDWAVLGGYFLSLVLIGWYYARKTATAEDYLLGGRNMKSWMVGLSLFAALLSTATYMSMPGEIVKHGPMIMAQLIAIPAIIWVVGWLLIPTFMKMRVTSANEILEIKLGLSVRMLGSAFFLFSRLAWVAMIIYITAKAVLLPIMGLGMEHLPWVCLLIGVVTMAYTSTGGLKAAVLADVIQSFILLFGAVLAIVLISFRLKGFGWFPTEWSATWDPPVFWFDTQSRITFMGAGMMMFFWYICVSGSDQVAVQRFLATKDLKSARSAFNVNLFAVALVFVFLGLLGFALHGYFLERPHELAAGMNLRTDADQIFPHFIVSGLPSGVSGLIVAGLLAAALSSLSAGLNSTCAVVTVDFLDRFNPKKLSDAQHVKRARIVSIIIGFVVIGLSLLVDRVPGNFLEIINKLGNLLVAPLFILFFMAIFVRWANAAGTWAGAATGVAVAVGIAFFGIFGLSFIWIMPCSLIAGIVVGCLVSLVAGGKKDPNLGNS